MTRFLNDKIGVRRILEMSSKSRDNPGLEKEEVTEDGHDEGDDEGEEDGQDGDGFVVRRFFERHLGSISIYGD